MQSPEYPDLAWMPPKSWTKADRKTVQVVVIHATDNREGVDTAEGGGRYDQDRTDGTSTHFFHDADSTVQCVRTPDIAHAARTNGNRIGIQHELCGYASQTAGQWADAVSKATLRQAARQVARDCRKWGIPVRKLTATQVAAGVKGICGHVDITNAFPQDRGTHTDPGPNFPWPTFLALVQAELNDQEDTVSADDVKKGVAAFFWDGYHASMQDETYQKASADDKLAMRNSRDILRGIVGGPVDPAAVAAQVVNQLPAGGRATEADIEQALRTVLRTGVGTA